MRRALLWINIAFLTFFLGLIITGLLLINPYRMFALNAMLAPGSQIRFNLVRSYSGERSEYQHYEAVYGVKLMRARMDFGSPERAKCELWQKIELNGESAQILERGQKVNQQGEEVGERVLVVLTGEERGQLTYVLWTKGSTLYWIESSSLLHALEVEQTEGF